MTYEETVCALYEGELLPRVGDFVGSKIARTRCGFVASIGTHETTGLKIFMVELARGQKVAVLENDIQFYAPKEWE